MFSFMLFATHEYLWNAGNTRKTQNDGQLLSNSYKFKGTLNRGRPQIRLHPHLKLHIYPNKCAFVLLNCWIATPITLSILLHLVCNRYLRASGSHVIRTPAVFIYISRCPRISWFVSVWNGIAFKLFCILLERSSNQACMYFSSL